MAAATGTAQWSSRFTFIMAAVGSSVGLGNLWRFSAELGTNGGAAFLVIYLACIIFVGLPVLMSEYMIGRSGDGANAVGSMADLAKKSGVSGLWTGGAWFGLAASFLIVSFYCVVAAWVMAYIPKFLFGSFHDAQGAALPADEIAGQFSTLISSPMSVLPYFLIFALITTWLISRGVNKGIEVAARYLMPLFFVLLIGLAGYSIITSIPSGGTSEALSFMFTPDFSKITPEIAISALGQACFSIGIGNAIMITYGSYIPRDVSIPKAALTVSLTDTLVALSAGLAIFPIVFANDLNFAAGAGVFFETLPNALVEAPGGRIIGAAFFFLAFFAAITSSVSLLEPSAAYASEKLNISKSKAAWLTGGMITLVGLGSLMSLEFMDLIDTGIAGPILAPLSALLIVVFTGWRLNKKILDQEMAGEGEALGRFIMIFVRYIAPIFIGIVLVFGIWQKYGMIAGLAILALLGVIIVSVVKQAMRD